jgi:hypothetical protein
MAEQEGYQTGKDAAYIKPKFIPNDELRARDNSGGLDFEPYTAEFGDGGRVTGDKAHLSARGGGDTEEPMTERKMGEKGQRGRAKPKNSGEMDD